MTWPRLRLPARKVISRRFKILLAIFLLWLSTYGAPAWADSSQPVSVMLSPFDLTDSHGIRISQFALNVNMGNALTSTWKLMLTPILIGAWAIYSWSIAVIAWALNWTLDMQWAVVITSGFNGAASAIRDNLLAPIGATSFSGGIMSMLLSIAAVTAVLIARRRGMASGAMSALWSSLGAALAIGALAMPMTSLAGSNQLAKPLSYARGVAIDSMAAINGQTPPSDPTTDTLPDSLKPSTTLIDSFVRLPHQMYNYGQVLDGGKCQGAYDDALKRGPVAASSDTIRSAVGDCDGNLKKYADNPDYWWLMVQAMFAITAFGVGATVGMLLILAWLSVMLLCWAALKTMFHALMAIVSPDSWGPLVNDLIGVGVAAVQVATGPILLAIGLKVIHATFAAGSGDSTTLAGKFILADVLLAVLSVLMLINWRAHKQWGRKLWRKIAERTPAQRPTQGKNMVLKSLVGAEAGRMAWRRFHEHRPRGATPAVNTGAGAGVRRLPTSPAAVSAGVKVAAGALTGGTGTAAITGASTAAKALTAYRTIRAGAEAGGVVGNAGVQIARAHNFVASQRNRALNALDDRIDSARTLATTGQATAGARGEAITTGSAHADRVLTGIGRGRTRTAQAIEAGTDVIAAARSSAHRGETPTTGSERLDATLSRIGRGQKKVDEASDYLTKPRSATPVVPRTAVAAPRRDTNPAPRRPAPGATRAPRPTPQQPVAAEPVGEQQSVAAKPTRQRPRGGKPVARRTSQPVTPPEKRSA